MAIAQQALWQPAPHVVAVLATTGRIRNHLIRTSPTPRLRDPAAAVVAGPAVA